MTSAPPPRLMRDPATVWRAGAFGVVIYPPGADEPRTLEGTAVAVWEALGNQPTSDELVTELAAAFRADRAAIRADVDPLLEELLASGALARIEG